MRVLLISTYELGHQPLHVASPAAALAAAGHDVRAVDLKLDRVPDDDLHWAQAVAISVPMHTAMQLARPVVADLNVRFPSLPICLYGLYATAAADRIVGVDRFIAGEYEPALLDWVTGIVGGLSSAATVVEIGRTSFVLPDRTRLPLLDRYAHLEIGGEHRIVGYLEASHGCRHRCRHCPLPVVYDGTFRTVPVELIVADADQLVAGGAGHITFGDPDFFNGPHHGMRTLRGIHERHPEVTFDVTVKVEHILRHQDLLAEMANLGVVFVVSAFETTNETVLEKLEKGHTAADAAAAVSLVRAAGIDIRPSWMPFTPWSTVEDLIDIFEFVARHDIDPDPVQLTIRLLIPEGSLVLDIPGIDKVVSDFDVERLSYRWEAPDHRLDVLQARMAATVAAAADAGLADRWSLMQELWSMVLDAAGQPYRELALDAGSIEGRPRLTEPWFC